jgi:hypothetical protein
VLSSYINTNIISQIKCSSATTGRDRTISPATT